MDLAGGPAADGGGSCPSFVERRALSAAARGATVDRVLLSIPGQVPEARLRISDGLGGVAEVRLMTTPDGRIAVQLLTATTGSRETLVDVMKEVRLRLRRRGIALMGDLDDGPCPDSRPRERAR